MQLPPHTALHLVTTDEVWKPSLNYIRIEQGHAVATDGRSMAIVPVTLGPGEVCGTGLIPASDMAAACSLNRDGTPVTLELKGDEAGVRYPDWRRPIPRLNHGTRVTFDARRLLGLVEAMPGSSTWVHIHVDTENPDAPFIITKPREEGIGLLMPCYFHNDPAAELSTHPNSSFVFTEIRLAAARQACLEAREFWTAEKEQAALATG